MAQNAPREPLPLSPALEARAVLVRQGERCAAAYVLVSGALFATCVSDDGLIFAVDVLGPGDLACGPVDVASSVTVTALRRSTFRLAGREEVSPLLADRERRATAAACSLVWLELGARLEDRMQDLAARFGRAAPGGISIDLGLRQEELAWLVGASRESVNRELARNRWIRPVARGRYLVRPRLEAVDAS